MRTSERRVMLVRRVVAVGLLGLLALVTLEPAVEADALTPLPEYVSFLEAGGLHHRLAFGSETSPLVEPAAIPAGDAGLEPPVEIVAYSWSADGTSIAILAHGTGTGLFREFACDQQGKGMRAVSAASPSRPATFEDGSKTDPPPDAAATSPDGNDKASIGPLGDAGVPQVFFKPMGGEASVAGPEEIRGRACSRVSFSPGGRYLAYEVARPDGGSDVWVTRPGANEDSAIASEGGSRPAWQPYYRPDTLGGGTVGGGTTSDGSGGKGCAGPFGL